MLEFLTEPDAKTINPDSKERFLAHRRILERKTEILDVFMEIQDVLISQKNKWCLASEGLEIELGAGVYPLKENYKNVIATDVIEGPLIDKVLDAQNMFLPDNSVKALYGQNCFHHFPNPSLFFRECIRVLKPGGVVVIVDPGHTPLSALLYPRLFPFEDYKKDEPSWEDKGQLKGPNQALSYLIFNRDKDLFQERFPELEIVSDNILDNYARYLLSGGLNFRPLIPRSLFPAVKWIEKKFVGLKNIFGLHHVYVLRKKSK